MMAAYRTVDLTMNLHSFQIYFLARGNPEVTTKYVVDPVISGKSYVKRLVSVIQNEIIIAKVNLSFKTEEPPSQFTYIPKAPSVINHDQCSLITDVINENLSKPHKEITFKKLSGISKWFSDFPVDVKPLDSDVQSLIKQNPSNKLATWVKLRDNRLLDLNSRSTRHAFLGFVSDYFIFSPITTMNCFDYIGMMASLDHVMWFHCNKFDPKQWLLIEAGCIIANNGTALNSGYIWSENGILLTTVMQEGLIRPPIAKT